MTDHTILKRNIAVSEKIEELLEGQGTAEDQNYIDALLQMILGAPRIASRIAKKYKDFD